MLTVRIIPCLDVRDGQVVKGVKFANLQALGTPADFAAEYEVQGADELVVLDVSATLEGRGARLETVRSVRERISIPLTVGGGVGSAEDGLRLLEAGADKVAVNTAAVRRPEIIRELAAQFGSQCAVVAIDAARSAQGGSGWEVVIRSGKERTAIDVREWAEKAQAYGAGEILLTSWDQDGTGTGYDLDLLRCVCDCVEIPVIASGGAKEPAHFASAALAGATGLLAASIFHYRETSIGEIKQALKAQSIEVRLC